MSLLDILADTALSTTRCHRRCKTLKRVSNVPAKTNYLKRRKRSSTGNVFDVEELLKSRPSKKNELQRQYLTAWKGYTKHSWNDECDFIGSDLKKMMIIRDLKDEAPWILSSWTGALVDAEISADV